MAAPGVAPELTRLEAHLANRFDASAGRHDRFAGIIGDRPSQYAKSPSLWNAAFADLTLPAVFLPFDVDEPKLGEVVAALRTSPRCLGFSVTVPYKIRILDLLDDVEPTARRIGAVNTVARTEDGRLVGYNTDGTGFLASLTTTVVEPPLVAGPLEGVDALLIGAGGAARAVAFYLAERIAPGRLFVANRTRAHADDLAKAVTAAYGNATAIDEGEIPAVAARAGLIVNGTTKGQAGLRQLPNGRKTALEAYSSLASADTVPCPEGLDPDSAPGRHAWFAAAASGIADNNRRSIEIAARVPASAAAYDLVYAPLESVFLRHMRQSGHRTANGKGMNIAQAVDGFCDRVCPGYLRESGFDAAAARRAVIGAMSRVW